MRTVVSRADLKRAAKQLFKHGRIRQEVRFMPGFVDRVKDARQQTEEFLERINKGAPLK
jgi:hypothetical protein